MIIGVDFDNTIVCYDGIFHRLALERKLIPLELQQSKLAVRDFLRRAGREEEWTELQGQVYGVGMPQAIPYPNALPFINAYLNFGMSLVALRRNWPAQSTP